MEFEGKVRFLENPKNIWEYIPYPTKVRGERQRQRNELLDQKKGQKWKRMSPKKEAQNLQKQNGPFSFPLGGIFGFGLCALSSSMNLKATSTPTFFIFFILSFLLPLFPLLPHLYITLIIHFKLLIRVSIGRSNTVF